MRPPGDVGVLYGVFEKGGKAHEPLNDALLGQVTVLLVFGKT